MDHTNNTVKGLIIIVRPPLCWNVVWNVLNYRYYELAIEASNCSQEEGCCSFLFPGARLPMRNPRTRGGGGRCVIIAATRRCNHRRQRVTRVSELHARDARFAIGGVSTQREREREESGIGGGRERSWWKVSLQTRRETCFWQKIRSSRRIIWFIFVPRRCKVIMERGDINLENMICFSSGFLFFLFGFYHNDDKLGARGMDMSGKKRRNWWF